MQQALIDQNLLKRLKSNVDKVDIDKLKNVQTNLSNLKSKVDKLDFDKLVPVPVDLSKLSNVVKMMLSKKMYRMLRLVVLKTKYLVLRTQLLLLLLILK